VRYASQLLICKNWEDRQAKIITWRWNSGRPAGKVELKYLFGRVLKPALSIS